MTIAELKRRLTLGTKVTLVAAPWLKNGQEIVRTVTTVQTNAIAMTPANNAPEKANVESWLTWKGLIAEDTADGFAVYWKNDDPSYRLIYRW